MGFLMSLAIAINGSAIALAESHVTAVVDHPVLVLATTVLFMWIAAQLGRYLGKLYPLDEQIRNDYSVLVASAMTLLALLVGFGFSMALNRYDQRKNYEEAEANAIGTEYLRADLLPETDATKTRNLLRAYLEQRIQFYVSTSEDNLAGINAQTAGLQGQLWDSVLPASKSQPSPITALAVSGMNDVINTQGYTQSAWWYRIPGTAWILMFVISLGCNVMIGYGSRRTAASRRLLIAMPILIAVAFRLIADIDSPRRGLIVVSPQNLVSLADSLRPK